MLFIIHIRYLVITVGIRALIGIFRRRVQFWYFSVVFLIEFYGIPHRISKFSLVFLKVLFRILNSISQYFRQYFLVFLIVSLLFLLIVLSIVFLTVLLLEFLSIFNSILDSILNSILVSILNGFLQYFLVLFRNRLNIPYYSLASLIVFISILQYSLQSIKGFFIFYGIFLSFSLIFKFFLETFEVFPLSLS